MVHFNKHNHLFSSKKMQIILLLIAKIISKRTIVHKVRYYTSFKKLYFNCSKFSVSNMYIREKKNYRFKTSTILF